jgi:Xaa-Pro aminopeptidase
MGKIRRAWREAYETVLAAHKQAASRAREDVSLVEVDRAAREVLKGRDLAERFVHGLGHGIGMEVHEAPSLSAKAKGALAAGDCFTIEPGVYIEGKFGIRLEDDYRIGRRGGAVRISRLPRDLAWASLNRRRSR